MTMKRKEYIERLEQLIAAHPKGKPLDEMGRLLPDPTPMAPPIGYEARPSMVDIVREQIRVHMAKVAAEEGYESFEDADDFDVDDEPEIKSHYEIDERSEVPMEVLKQRWLEAQAAENDTVDPPSKSSSSSSSVDHLSQGVEGGVSPPSASPPKPSRQPTSTKDPKSAT